MIRKRWVSGCYCKHITLFFFEKRKQNSQDCTSINLSHVPTHVNPGKAVEKQLACHFLSLLLVKEK